MTTIFPPLARGLFFCDDLFVFIKNKYLRCGKDIVFQLEIVRIGFQAFIQSYSPC